MTVKELADALRNSPMLPEITNRLSDECIVGTFITGQRNMSSPTSVTDWLYLIGQCGSLEEFMSKVKTCQYGG